MFKIKPGKELQTWEDLVNTGNQIVFIKYPMDTNISAVVDLSYMNEKSFYKAIGDGYHFYERVKEEYSKEVGKFIELFNEFKSDAKLQETEDLTNKELEDLYNQGWRLTKKKIIK